MNDMREIVPDIRLRLHMAHPNYEESYVFGYECATNNLCEEDNPFSVGSQEHEHWLEGWWAGFYAEEPLFQILSEKQETSGATVLQPINAANEAEHVYQDDHFAYSNLMQVLTIAGAITATAVIGYQLFEMVA